MNSFKMYACHCIALQNIKSSGFYLTDNTNILFKLNHCELKGN